MTTTLAHSEDRPERTSSHATVVSILTGIALRVGVDASRRAVDAVGRANGATIDAGAPHRQVDLADGSVGGILGIRTLDLAFTLPRKRLRGRDQSYALRLPDALFGW